MRTKIELGQKVTETIHVDKGMVIKGVEGTVVYIHPKRRFYRVKFITPTGHTIHESYFLYRSKSNG